jgi:hypothetical protein
MQAIAPTQSNCENCGKQLSMDAAIKSKLEVPVQGVIKDIYFCNNECKRKHAWDQYILWRHRGYD